MEQPKLRTTSAKALFNKEAREGRTISSLSIDSPQPAVVSLSPSPASIALEPLDTEPAEIVVASVDLHNLLE